MEYHPRGNVKTILNAMEEQDPATEWTTEQLAAVVDIESDAVSTTLKTALRHQLLFKQKRGIRSFYSLTSFEPEPEPEEFKAALWTDGELVVYGVPQNDDGSFTLSAEQLTQIKRLVAWSPAA